MEISINGGGNVGAKWISIYFDPSYGDSQTRHSINGRAPNRSQRIMILVIMGTPNKGPLNY